MLLSLQRVHPLNKFFDCRQLALYRWSSELQLFQFVSLQRIQRTQEIAVLGRNGTSSCTIGCVYMKSFVFAISCIRTHRGDVANFSLCFSGSVPELQVLIYRVEHNKLVQSLPTQPRGFPSDSTRTTSLTLDLGSRQLFCPTKAFSVRTCSPKDAVAVCDPNLANFVLYALSGQLRHGPKNWQFFCRERFPTENHTFFYTSCAYRSLSPWSTPLR